MNSAIQTQIKEFEVYLKEGERSIHTITKYLYNVQSFFIFLEDRPLSKAEALEWKTSLIKDYAPVSINSMLASLNSFFDFIGQPQYKIKPLKIQKEIFAKPDKVLSGAEYKKLVYTAEKKGNRRLSLLLQTICATGIRVSELQYITVESAQVGRAIVDCKNKRRIIFLPEALCHVLRSYIKLNKIKTGTIFLTKNGKPLNRSNIWRDMKALCKSAGVEAGKVFPHNLRHLFARTYYRMEKDISRLADLLGHSNVTTTRIYTMENGTEHLRQLGRMGLVFNINKKTT